MFELYYPELTCFENDPTPAPEPTPTPAPAPTSEPTPLPEPTPTPSSIPAPEKTFTQAELEKHVQARVRTMKTKNEQLVTQYETLLAQTNVTGEQRAHLEGELENVQAELRTKQEQAEYDASKAATVHSEELQLEKERGDLYQGLYETTTINHAIGVACNNHEGFDVDQFIDKLGPKAKIVDEVDSEGKPTGNLVPRIEWSVTKEDGVVEVVRYTADEVVKLMKEDTKKHGNMFRSNVSAGVGSGNAPGQLNGTDARDMSNMSDTERMAYLTSPEGRKAQGLTPLSA